MDNRVVFRQRLSDAPPSATNPDLSKRQFGKNLAANALGFGLGIVSGCILTPYWIKSFGVAAYGLVPLTNNLVAYFTLIAAIISSSIGRFVTIEVGRGNYERANRIFNTSLWASVVLGAIVLAAGGTASFFTQSLIEVPEGFLLDSRMMMMMATLSFVISTLAMPFGVATFCANRIDLTGLVAIVAHVLRIVIAVGLVTTVYSRPTAMMIASLIGSLVAAAAAVCYWRRLMPWSRIARTLDFKILFEQISFGTWNVLNQIGAVLYLQIDLLVINRMLGPELGGQYAAMSQWSFLMRSLGATVYAVFAPSIMHHYARNDIGGVVRHARWGIRVLGLVLALPIGIICGLAAPLLTCWLGPGYSQFGWLLMLMVLPLCVNISVYPLFTVQSAINRVKVPAIVTCLMGMGNVVLAVALTYKLGMYGVALAGAIMLTGKNIVFTPLYTARALGSRWHVFFREILQIWLLTSAVAALGLVASHHIPLATWPRLTMSAIGIGLAYVPTAWFALLTSDERKQLQRRLLAPTIARLADMVR